MAYQRLLAFDFGMKRIGVAVGQSISRTAKPLPPLTALDGIPNWEQIQTLIQNWQPEALVVGIPYNMDGTEQPITLAARKFANRLYNKFQRPILFMDERLTTVEAKRQIIGNTERKRYSIDSVAAKLILESWLQENT